MRYPLLPYSQLVYESTRWTPWIYRFGVSLLWRNMASEIERVEQSVRAAINNHPVFSSAIDRHGLQYETSRQDILHSPYLDLDITTEDNDIILLAKMSRILGDSRSVEILLEDIQTAYNGLPLPTDDYWGYVASCEKLKLESHYQASRNWLIQEFADESVPVRPIIDRHLFSLLPPKVGFFDSDYTDLHEHITRLTEQSFLSMDGFFSLCTALAIAEYCDSDSAALTWAYEGRERPEEQHIFGSLHRDIPFQIKNLQFQNSNHKSDLIRYARNQIRSGIAHSDYPYTLSAPYNKRWNYAVNVLHVKDINDIVKDTPFEVHSISKQKYAYALLDVEIVEHTGIIQVRYRYSASHYKKESIRRFATLVRKYAEWLLEE